MDYLDEDIGESESNAVDLRSNLSKRIHIASLLKTDKTVEELEKVASMGRGLIVETLNEMERDGEVTQLPSYTGGASKYTLTYFGEDLINQETVADAGLYTHSALWSALSMGQFNPAAHWVVSKKVEPLRVR